MTIDKNNFRSRLLRRMMLSTVGFFFVLAIILFLPAGIGWRKGWLFFLVFLVFMVLSARYLWRKNPEIFVARSKVHEGTKCFESQMQCRIRQPQTCEIAPSALSPEGINTSSNL